MISRVPLRDEVYRELLDRIQRGHYPDRARLQDTELASELGVSRTPVREALIRLAREGVLDSSMGRGFRIRGLDPGELREVGTILGSLEALALRLSSDPSPSQLERLAQLAQRLERTRGDAIACLDLEDEWHQVLLEGCPNRRLLELIASLRQVPRRYLAAYMREARRLSLSTLPHARILAALRESGRDSAAAVFEQQWRKALAELEDWTTQRSRAAP